MEEIIVESALLPLAFLFLKPGLKCSNFQVSGYLQMLKLEGALLNY